MSGSRANWVTVAVAMVGLVVPFIGATSASAVGIGKPCVSKAEYHKVNHNMRMKHVHFVFDTVGHRTFHAITPLGTRYVSRKYKTCLHPRVGFVHVDYKNGVLDGKAAYWG
jgi:hypothetical protein